MRVGRIATRRKAMTPSVDRHHQERLGVGSLAAQPATREPQPDARTFAAQSFDTVDRHGDFSGSGICHNQREPRC
jgi:hypothetical protein